MVRMAIRLKALLWFGLEMSWCELGVDCGESISVMKKICV